MLKSKPSKSSAIRRALSAVAGAVAAIACAAAVFMSGAGSALAPSPARLDGALSYMGSWSYATYVNTQTRTYAFEITKDWMSHWAYAGYPCTTTNASSGASVYGYVVASGSYRRCAGL